MAGREKKPALLKKQMSSAAPQKDGEATDNSDIKTNSVKTDTEICLPQVVPITKRVKKTKPKKIIKKNLKINFKAKTKKTNKLKLTKSIFNNSKLNLDSKNVKLLKNGIKNKKRKKVLNTNDHDITAKGDCLTAVLESVFPIPEGSPAKKEIKKRTKKLAIDDALEKNDANEKKAKLDAELVAKETVEDVLNDVANELKLDLDALMKKPVRKKAVKKKTDAKLEESPKTKRGTPKKTKAETSKLKKTAQNKKIIESLSKDITLDSAAENVINSLDLNVTKKQTAKKKAIKKRRHSIEKIPIVTENVTDVTFEQPFALFTNPRRSASPRAKRNSRTRQSIDGAIPRRLNPYTTRSDSPARILRNGKHRKLKDNQLLEGLDSAYKKRRRLGSEYSGSGYLSESDSSFSDLTPIQDNGIADDSLVKEEPTKTDILKQEILDSIKIQTISPTSDVDNLSIKQISTKFAAILKRSFSTDTDPSEMLPTEDVKPILNDTNANSFIDTNSNDVKLHELNSETETKVATHSLKQASDYIDEKQKLIKIEKTDEEHIFSNIASSPSEKVPDKSLILDQMKHTFNDSNEEYEKRTTRSSKRNLKLEEVKPDVDWPETLQDSQVIETGVLLNDVPQNITTELPEESDKVNGNSTITGQDLISKLLKLQDNCSDKNIAEEKEINSDVIDTQCEKESDNEETKVPESVLAESNSFTEQTEEMLDEAILTKFRSNVAISITSIKEIQKEPSQVLTELNSDIHSHELEENYCEKENISNDLIDFDPAAPMIEETPENLAIKENILSALGLQSLKAAEEAKLRDKEKIHVKPEVYTGTLKTVIKLNRQVDKKKRIPLKMTLQKSKIRNLKDGYMQNVKADGATGNNEAETSCYKVMKESAGTTSGWRHGSQSSDTVGANRKSHYSNRSNMDGSSEHASDGDVPAPDGETTTKLLVIPEKASSFSIHPDRLCSDECAYCFGKFGLFDTPLHIAQIKSVERQNKILEVEIYLNRDSCLCDACYRHVDRRTNNKNYKRNTLTHIPRNNHCHVMGCYTESSHVLRRKWLIKMKKSVSNVITIPLDNPGLHSIPICSDHYAAVEHLMVCALCKRRLARNHIHYLGFEWSNLNAALEKEGIPVQLSDKPVVCKLCRYYASLLLKPPEDIKSAAGDFFKQYKKRLLHFHDIEIMNEAEAEEPISVPLKEKSDKELLKKQRKSRPKNKSTILAQTSVNSELQMIEAEKTDQSRVPSTSENGESRESTPSDCMVDIESLVPNMVLECASDTEDNTNNSRSEVPLKAFYKKLQIPESVREAVEISKLVKANRKSGNVVDRLGSNPSISVRQLFPGEEDLPLQGHIDFSQTKERTPEGWEKCSCTIQYDVDTKHLWNELQKPYGNQSSFLRHLILLEKYFRNGDLTLSPNASHHAVNYSVSVQNRLRAYDNIPTNSLPMQPLTMLPFNQVKKSQSGIITTKDTIPNISSMVNAANLPKNTPIPISQLNANFFTQLSVRQKPPPGVPPGLISLQPGTNRPVGPLVKMSQKFKLPTGNNWRPTLIPVLPQSKTSPLKGGAANRDKRVTGLVQVISGGKPYHISLQDYNRMCSIKKTLEMRHKAMTAVESKLKQSENESASNSILKPVVPRKQKSTATSTIVNKAHLNTVVKEITAESAKHTTERLKDLSATDAKNNPAKSVMILPKIPKSLTVIPQTVPRKPFPPSSPTLSILSAKPSTSKS